jgi:two-component system phosphate regulon sensor histidine kinase PhoR
MENVGVNLINVPGVGGIIITSRDITERKLIEQRLEDEKIAAQNVFIDLNEEKKRLDRAKAKEDAILSSIGDGIIAIDKNGKIIFINQTAEKMLGFSAEESLGRLWHAILKRDDEKGNLLSPKEGAFNAALSAAATTRTTVTNSFYYLRKDGTKFPVSRTVSPIILSGRVIGAINIFRDITREKEIDRAKTEFVSLASHQLRTPLTGIAWLIELILKKENLTEKGRMYLNDIILSIHRSNMLVRLLLDTSRIENENVGVHPESFEMVNFVQSHLNEYRMLSESKKISVILTQHPEKLSVVSDMNLLEYVLQNLVTNAIDYTPSGGRIEILLEKKENSLLLQVRDTGIGIPKNEQSRLFQKFMRLSNAIAIKTNGTGLGLYIAREAVRLLGGKIWVESPIEPEGKGSAFFVELPLISVSRPGGGGLAFVREFK